MSAASTRQMTVAILFNPSCKYHTLLLTLTHLCTPVPNEVHRMALLLSGTVPYSQTNLDIQFFVYVTSVLALLKHIAAAAGAVLLQYVCVDFAVFIVAG